MDAQVPAAWVKTAVPGLAKLPSAFVEHFEELVEAAGTEVRAVPTEQEQPATSPTFGVEYRVADEEAATSERDAFAIDPAIVDRGNRGHAATQNWLAKEVIGIGLHPRSPSAEDCNFDLAWRDSEGVVYVAEVKSTTQSNEEKQLRLGLGQVLRYRQLLAGGSVDVPRCACIEKTPSDPGWLGLCSDSRRAACVARIIHAPTRKGRRPISPPFAMTPLAMLSVLSAQSTAEVSASSLTGRQTGQLPRATDRFRLAEGGRALAEVV